MARALAMVTPHAKPPAPRIRKVCGCGPCRERRHADHLRFVIALYEERISAMKRELEGLAR
jgi:hypothetical protein